jgi:pimeloyl-ACP methyl ester carboxylesterase
MYRKLLFIAGTLATEKIWHMQASLFAKNWQVGYLELDNTPSISSIAEHYSAQSPDKFSIIAFSMGGYVALDLFRFIPNKIEKLILINSAAKALCQKGKEERQRSIALIEKGKFNFLIDQIFINSVYKSANNPKLISFLKAMAHEVGADYYHAQLTAMVNKPDQTDILNTIPCPVLLIAGRQDNVMPNERSEHMAAHIPNADLVYLNNCGHTAMLEQPQCMNDILLNWL